MRTQTLKLQACSIPGKWSRLYVYYIWIYYYYLLYVKKKKKMLWGVTLYHLF